ncbi:MAG TPA: ACT domain-containing protein [Pseudonocardiaceae bacterium]|nr:ACT domain-containing protein [Pseudonocardiaceae bacterium]
MRKLTLVVMPGEYTVARLGSADSVPDSIWRASGLVSVTRTTEELSVVAPAEALARIESERAEPGWRLLTVRGPLAFTLSGIMAALTGELAAAGVPLFALSTFDTDHLLVKDADLGRAITALRTAGHEVA